MQVPGCLRSKASTSHAVCRPKPTVLRYVGNYRRRALYRLAVATDVSEPATKTVEDEDEPAVSSRDPVPMAGPAPIAGLAPMNTGAGRGEDLEPAADEVDGGGYVHTGAERSISIELAELHAAVRDEVAPSAEDKERLDEVAWFLECLCHQQFSLFRRNIKHNIAAFSAGAKGQPLAGRVVRDDPSEEELDQREQKILEDFVQLMAAARYQVLTAEQWAAAKKEAFKFTLPVAVNWDAFDPEMLTRFWASSPECRELRAHLPDMADRILVFHRGVGIAEASDRYISQKIDLFLDRTLLRPFIQFGQFVANLPRRLFLQDGKAKPVANMAVTPLRPQVPAPKLSRRQRQTKVERRTLARVLPTNEKLLKELFAMTRLQEPTFKEVIILFRSANPPPPENKDSVVDLHGRLSEKRQRKVLSERNIHVKSFHNVPMADVEVVFPDKKVFIKPLAVVQLAGAATVAAFTAWATLWKAGTSVSVPLVWSVLSAILVRCAQLYGTLQGKRTAIQSNMVSMLYNATSDSQEGVISMVLEDLAEEQVKELLITHALLYGSCDSGPLTVEELDDRCEAFLNHHFNLAADFSCMGALQRLVDWGLAEEVEPGRYKSVPLEMAPKLLKERWVEAPSHLRDEVARLRTWPLEALLGDAGPGYDAMPSAMAPSRDPNMHVAPVAARRADEQEADEALSAPAGSPQSSASATARK